MSTLLLANTVVSIAHSTGEVFAPGFDWFTFLCYVGFHISAQHGAR